MPPQLGLLSAEQASRPCQPVLQHEAQPYQPGDYVKVEEFPDEATGIGEWMWVRVRVTRCDDERKTIFGTLDNEPIADYEGKIRLGSELAIKYF
jgi:hypothetical protein